MRNNYNQIDSGSQRTRRPSLAADDPLIEQPQPRVFGVLLEPLARRTQAERIAPVIQVAKRALAPTATDLVGEQHLQVTDATFLEVVATRIGIEPGAAFGGHADVVAGLVQQRMQRRVASDEDLVAHQPGFAFTPEAAGDLCVVIQQAQRDPVTRRWRGCRALRAAGRGPDQGRPSGQR